MRLFARFLLVMYLCLFYVWLSAPVRAQTSTTPNLINNTWSGAVPYTGTGGGAPGEGGPPGYNSSNNTIYFSWQSGTVAQAIAINQALSGTGIQISGYNYSWQYYNFGESQGSLTGQIRLTSPTGSALQTYNYSMPVQGNQWYTQSGTQNFSQSYGLASVGNLEVSFSGQDNKFWGGYYGPQIRNVNVGLNYSVDPCVVNPQSSPSCPGYKTYYTFGDDSYAHVPLPFGFPFYGRVFTNSWMHSNGVVSFLDPLSLIEPNDGGWAYCCGGPDLGQNTASLGSRINYLIAPFWTDLYPGPTSEFYTTKDANHIRYHWKNIGDISNGANLNTFNLELRPTGYIGANYTSINSQQTVTIGTIGNLALGEKTHQFFGIPGKSVADWSLNSTQATDCSNPLTNPACPGYAEAYFAQQCTISALYNTQCPGYAAAYFVYQCTANPLYSPNCPGYTQAYFSQQCSLNPLYNSQCPGYADAYYVQQCTANPLYDTGCTGYAQAYFAQQCNLDGLYSNQCPNYAEAYAKKNILNIGSSTPTVSTPVQETVVVATATNQSSNPPVIADPVVNQTVTATATSASPAQATTATVPLVPAPQPVIATVVATKEEKKEETKTVDSKDSSAPKTSASSSSTDQPKTTRQALAERRLEAARTKAVEEGKNLASKMGEAATIEAQVAVQNVVIQAMGFTPGFDAYGKAVLPDAVGYRPFEIYKGQRNIDNPAGRRFMTGSDRLHTEMVDAQYKNR